MNTWKRKARAVKRFWSRVNIKGKNECWLWKPGPTSPDGYAQVWWEGKGEMVHRVSMAIYLGRPILSPTRKLDQGEIIRHRCDTPLCTNPNHLLLGTQADNIKDRDTKGRTCKGTHRPAAKLTEANVRSIRKIYKKRPKGTRMNKPWKYGMPSLARKFGVHISIIDSVLKQKTWKHVH